MRRNRIVVPGAHRRWGIGAQMALIPLCLLIVLISMQATIGFIGMMVSGGRWVVAHKSGAKHDEHVTGLAAAQKRRPLRKKKMGFNMPAVDEKPVENYDSGPKVLDIVRYPHPALRRPNKEIENFDDRLQQFAENLFSTMYAKDNGIGLAAPQVGVNLRMMVYNPLRRPHADNKEGQQVFVNPKIIARSDKQDEMYESCLSFPGIDAPISRPMWIEVEAMDLQGQPVNVRMEGLEARVFQHEYDHLDGVLLIDRVDKEDEVAQQEMKPGLNTLVQEYAAGGGKEQAL